MRKFTFVFSLLLMLVTTAMAQKAHQRVSHDGWVVTALNEAGVYGNEGGVAFIADDNAKTFYHSNWGSNYDDGNGIKKGKDGLQAFMVELPTSVSDISLISYTGRSDNNTSGWAKGVRIYIYETLPEGLRAKGLSSLSYTEKEALLAKTNTAVLGEPAFDNTASHWDVSGRNKQFAFFSEYKTGKYVLFVMDASSDGWLTCADFQIYQSKDYSVKEKSAYLLKATNAASEGDWYIDTKTAIADNQGLSTVAISQTAVETYFAWGENGWKISTNENVDGNYVGVAKWCAPPLKETATEWQMLINDNEEIVLFQSAYYGDNRISRCFLGGDVTTNTSVVKLYTDNYSEKAITLSLIDASLKPVEVTYNVLFNGKVKATQTVNTYIGANYPDVTVELPFGVSVNKPEGEILLSDATEVDGVYTITMDLDVAVSLPFKYADSVGNIKNWYYIQMHSSSGYGKYLQYHEGNYIEWTDGTRTVGEEDSYSWAFVGNPFDGLKLVNRYAPAEANAVTSAKDSGNPGFGPIDGATAWNIKASRTNVDSKYFCFQYPGSTQYMNAQGGKVAFWGDNDQGSTMWVTERDLTMTTELQALIDQVDAAIVAYGAGGNTVGYYTAESVNNLLTVLAAAKTAVADPDRTLDTNRAAMTNLQAAVAALKTIQPEENVLYTIQNVYSGVYMNVTKTGGTVKSGDATAYELFKFVAAEGGKYYLYNVTRNKYLSSAPKHGYGQVLFAAETTAEAKAVTIANLGKANQVSIVPDGGATVHHDANYGTIVAWNGGIDSRSAWVIAATGLSTAKMTVLTELGIFCSEKDDLLDKVGEGYGYYSGNDEALLAALSPELYSKTVTELAEMSDDAVAAAGTAAVNAVTEAANTFSLNVPAANSYVRIAYDFGGDTLYVQGEASGVSYKANAPIMTAATDAASIFYFADSTLLSYTAGLYLKEDGGTRGLQAMNAAAGEASFEAGSVLGTLAVKVPAYMHANTSGDVRFIDHCGGAGHTAHNMIVEAVTALPVTVTAAGYASFYAPVALEIPDSVEVFYATEVAGEYVTLVKIESGKIPANTGVIIKAAAKTYNFAITNENVDAIENNIFKGTVNKQVVTKGTSSCYVLGIVNDKVGMYNAVNGEDATTFINAGHKAYMCVEGAANSAGYRFDFDGTTGITEVETENAGDAVIYDLTGRRVQDMNRAGIYIVNGKKVLVK